MFRSSFKVYCFDSFVCVCCKRGSFYIGIGLKCMIYCVVSGLACALFLA